MDIETLARQWNKLNVWEWPDDLAGKPDGFDDMPLYFKVGDKRRGLEITKHDIITPLSEKIIKTIGLKECLRWHHLNDPHIKSTNDEFEKWWAARGPK